MWRFRRNKDSSDRNAKKKSDKNVSFVAGEFSEDPVCRKNPAQGWYSIYPFCVNEKINPEELKWCLKEDESVALVLLDLGAYQKNPLDFFALENIAQILRFFREAKKDIVLRPVYDQTGEGIEKEPDTLEQILEHIKQICGVLKEQKHTVFLVQGFLIGSWGEMHSSKYLSEQCLERLYRCMRENLPASICLAVRTPAIWRKLISEDSYNSEESFSLTIFNDALFASETDLGTYGTMLHEAAGWKGKWIRQEELRFAEKITRETPFGGEAVSGEKCKTEQVALQEMKQLHLAYLNRNHDPKRLKQWKEKQWWGQDCFQGKSFYEYVGAHLGYRFVVRGIYLRESIFKIRSGIKKCGYLRDLFCRRSGLSLEIEIENSGFGKCFQETALFISIENGSEERKITLDADLREWKSGELKKITFSLPRTEGRLYLHAYRKSDKANIHFANKYLNQSSNAQGKNPEGLYIGCIVL